jgi:hypothetical protein
MKAAIRLAAIAFGLLVLATGIPNAAAVGPQNYACAWYSLTGNNDGNDYHLPMDSQFVVHVKNSPAAPGMFVTVDVRNFQNDTKQHWVAPLGGSSDFSFSYFATAPTNYDIKISTSASDPQAIVTFKSSNCGITETGDVTSGFAGKCMDDLYSGTADGNPIDIWDCNETNAQHWTWGYHNAQGLTGEIHVFGKCLTPQGSSPSDGDLVILKTCSGLARQRWFSFNDGSLRSSGLCLADPQGNSTNGTQLKMKTCNGETQQVWTLPSNPYLITG